MTPGSFRTSVGPELTELTLLIVMPAWRSWPLSLPIDSSTFSSRCAMELAS
jgi:hypothetical protein